MESISTEEVKLVFRRLSIMKDLKELQRVVCKALIDGAWEDLLNMLMQDQVYALRFGQKMSRDEMLDYISQEAEDLLPPKIKAVAEKVKALLEESKQAMPDAQSD